MKKIILSPMGTTGDIRPFIALYLELKKLNFDVVMTVPKNGEALCNKFNIPYVTVDFDYRELVNAVEAKSPINIIIELLDREISAPFIVLKEICKDADFIIGNGRNYAVNPIAEFYGIPYFQVCHTVQVLESKYNTPWRFEKQNNPIWINSLLWKLHNFKENRIGEKFVNKHRVSLGLPPIKDYAGLFKKNILLVANNALSPIPPDVKADFYQTNYWHLFDNEELSPDLINFINNGKKPMFFSFGSRGDKDGDKTIGTIEKIVKSLDTRAIVQRGWAGLGQNYSGDRIKVIDAVPHHRLFPLMSGVVHHGGAGTTHTAAMGGVPQIVVPQMGDQFYWGNAVNNLKLGPTPIPKAKLDEGTLKDAILKIINDGEIKANVKNMAEIQGNGEKMDVIAKNLTKIMMERISK